MMDIVHQLVRVDFEGREGAAMKETWANNGGCETGDEWSEGRHLYLIYLLWYLQVYISAMALRMCVETSRKTFGGAFLFYFFTQWTLRVTLPEYLVRPLMIYQYQPQCGVRRSAIRT